MAPLHTNLDDIKIEDIDFDVVEECTDKRVIKQYIKLLEADGSYFVDLLNACKGKLLQLAPKEYYLLYPRVATDDEVRDATQDLLDWSEAVAETDKALKNSSKDKIWADVGPKTDLPIRGQEPVIPRPNLHKASNRIADVERPVKESERYARDKTRMKDYYNAWDQIDVDKMEEEMEREEREEEEARKRHFEELKEEQDGMHRTTPIQTTGVGANVPDAHRKHMADCEKEKGNEAFYAKDYEEAEAYYGRSLQYKADDPASWANRALARLKLERPEAALEDCEHALALNPRYMKALHRKGKALYDLQRYEEAVRCFQLALAESPGNTQINGDLMVARRKLRTEPSAPPRSREPVPRIEELEMEPQKPRNYTRVAIEEGSSDEEEEEDAGASGRPSAPGFRKVPIESASESEDEPPSRAPAPAAATGFRKVVIEELSDDEEDAPPARAPAAAPAPAPSATGFRKVQIESASEDEEDAPPAAAPAAAPAPAAASGFRKVAITVVSDSEEEEDSPPPAAQRAAAAGKSPAAAAAPTAAPAAAMAFAPPPRTAPAANGGAGAADTTVSFDDMD
eukprot:TRINITY_DN55633_c0_g1_i1.p1 TRINITY_DN55633_c0_g1~~TRINITY_DN55633_c0_g1_i1.p1  ORF type:complete len:569 (+),score=184.76 TRINITY_DN55633_c0_g1_i1:89-1795(+)